MNKFFIFLSVIVVLGASVYAGLWINKKFFIVSDPISTNMTTPDYRNSTIIIDGKEIKLVDGKSETESAPGSASKIYTSYFGNGVNADLDKDGNIDSAFLVTQETGGTGTFYYLVAVLNKKDGPISSKSIFIGDRIAPQSTTIDKNNVIIVNYADRKIGEDFSVRPSVGKSIWLKLDPASMQFGEVMQNFEGEADPDKMSLDMKTWVWEETIYNNDSVEKISLGKRYTITFNKKDRTFSATTDCNNISGKYKLGSDDSISFTNMAQTEMYCEGSNESGFSKMLSDIESFNFTSKGELKLNMKFDFGTLVFK